MKYRIFERLRQLKLSFNETKLMYGLSALVFLCGLSLLGWFVWQYFANANFSNGVVDFTNTKNEQSKSCDFRRVLDGVCVDSAEKTNPKLIAVMIENHPDARPQSGLSRASIVYEAPVEANYTRFMAIYPADAVVEQIGPVRSARPYYLDWVSEYGRPMYMHCGGSPDALGRIKEYGIFDLNEFFNGKTFWRLPSRSAPHNVYTSSELWQKVNDDGLKDIGYRLQDGWDFITSNSEPVTSTTSSISVNFLAPNYVVEWKYNSSTQKYERWQAGAEHRDADGTLITADTVIVQHVKTQVLDKIGRISMETVGSGAVEVYFDGQKNLGAWKKTERTIRTMFFSAPGGSASGGNEEIKLKAGKIWVEVINR